MLIKQKYYIIFLMLFFTSKSYAQYNPEDHWHVGKALLNDDTEIEGSINFNTKENLIRIKTKSGKLLTLTTRKVIYFTFMDHKHNYKREFYTFPYTIKSNYQTPIFFELILQGKHISLLVRQAIQVRNSVDTNPLSINYGARIPQSFVTNKFYFLKSSGKIKYYDSTKNGLLELLPDKKIRLEKYFKAHRVNLNKIQDVKDILLYYNQLKG